MVVKLLENREQVDKMINRLVDEARTIGGDAEQAVSLTIELTRKQFLEHGSAAPLFNQDNPELLKQWYSIFTMVGKAVLALRLRLATWSRSHFADLLMKKHELYGAAPITGWGMLGVMIRIDSKWQRYTNQMKKQQDDRQLDAMEDTLTDILGYCILGLALLDTFKQRYTNDEVKGQTSIIQ